MKTKKMYGLYPLLGVLACVVASGPAHAEQEGHGGDAYAMEFIQLGRDLATAMGQADVSSFPKVAPRFFSATVQATSVYTEDHLYLDTPGSTQKAEVDALNFPDRQEIQLNRSRWKSLNESASYAQKSALVLHEYLWMMGLDDSDYTISIPLFKALASKFVPHPGNIPANICDTPEETPVSEFSSVTEMNNKMSGVWVLCDHDVPLFGRQTFGLVFSTKGRWTALELGTDGILLQESGFPEEGDYQNFSISSGNGSPLFQTNIESAQGVSYGKLSFSTTGKTMRYHDTGGIQRLVSLVGKDMRMGEVGCTIQESSVTGQLGTAQALKDRIVGKWVTCQTLSILQIQGIEFTPDNHFYYLHKDGSGTLVRSDREDEYGDVDDTGSENPRLIKLSYKNRGTNFLSAAFSEVPLKVMISFAGGEAVLSAMP